MNVGEEEMVVAVEVAGGMGAGVEWIGVNPVDGGPTMCSGVLASSLGGVGTGIGSSLAIGPERNSGA